MIFVFSATGNSMHVARRIANATEDYIVDIADCLRSESFEFQTSANERVGFVFPTYFLGLPLPVEKFVEKLKLHCGQDAYVYLVTTFGTSPGASAALLPRLLKERTGITNPINTASVRMVDTWTPMFNVSDARRNHRIEQRAEVEIEEIASAIVTQSGLHMSGLRIPVWLARLYHSSYETERRTSRFRIDREKCSGCGRCARFCQSGTIQMADRHPRWNAPKCFMCLRCVHQCPSFAIDIGYRSRTHGQYIYPECK